ncbi:MAG TPA: tRNA-dihydrouridine synthase [Candidatus Saccharimonas sp.]|nr:tRNA-dihydrouridine synthase [Candidatus Saccharimonas sp.]
MNFWQELPKPFLVLAPMDDVTDVAFRQVVSRAAAPDVFFTEFVSTDGLQSAGRERTLERLRVEPDLSRPLVAQIWGSDPDKYYQSAQDIVRLGGFSGIDINMGCPERGIVARGCCGGLIGRYDQAAAIIEATKAGAGDLPVSVKTRIGLGTIITEEWAGFLLRQNLAALTIHARTVREMSKVPARWDEIAKVVALRDQLAPGTPIVGNGDAANRTHAHELAASSGANGVMIGRGIFHDLQAFAAESTDLDPAARLRILLEHVALYEQWGRTKPFQVLKKFFKIYVSGWPGAAELRAQLMDATTPAEVRHLIARAQLPVLHTAASAHPAPSQLANR